MGQCQFCNRIIQNKGGLKKHQNGCIHNPNRKYYTSNLIEYNNNIKNGKISRCPTNQFIKADKLNLPKPIVSNETRKKISNAMKGVKWDDDKKKQHSILMKRVAKKYSGSYSASNVCGRVKNIEYSGSILNGSWELVVIRYFESINVKCDRNYKGFEYQWSGSRTYYPDFHLPEYQLYIEVKGYERKRDLFKYEVVPNLIVIRGKEIEQMKNNSYIWAHTASGS